MFDKQFHKSTINDLFVKTDTYTCGRFKAWFFDYKPNHEYSVRVDNGGRVEVMKNPPEGNGLELVYSADGLDTLTEYGPNMRCLCWRLALYKRILYNTIIGRGKHTAPTFGGIVQLLELGELYPEFPFFYGKNYGDFVEIL